MLTMISQGSLATDLRVVATSNESRGKPGARHYLMDHPVIHFSTVFMAFFAIMNPIVNAPIFIGVTQGQDAANLRSIALRAALMAFAIVAVFALLGRQIFDVFGITLPAFRIAGGVLVALVGYNLLQGQDNSAHTPTAEDNSNSRRLAARHPSAQARMQLASRQLSRSGTLAKAIF